MVVSDAISIQERNSILLENLPPKESLEWCTLSDGTEVMRFPLRWEDGVMYGVTAAMTKVIAEYYDAEMMTVSVADRIAREGIVLMPYPQRPPIAAVSTMSGFSNLLDQDFDLHKSDTLPYSGWKHWIRMSYGRVGNYGWHVPKNAEPHWTPYRSVDGKFQIIQPLGFNHNEHHCDYSQLCQLKKSPSGKKYSVPSVEKDPKPTSFGANDRGRKDGPVHAWQSFLNDQDIPRAFLLQHKAPGKLSVDGIHGTLTERRTRAFNAYKAQDDNERVPQDKLVWFPTHRYRAVKDRPKSLVVLHSTENPPRAGVAMNVAKWMAGPAGPQASYHYIVGPELTVHMVKEDNAAWAAPGTNHDGIQVSLTGRAMKTSWTGEGLPVVKRASKLVADICSRNDIEPRFLTAEDLLEEDRNGITTHAQVSKACALARSRNSKAHFYREDRRRWSYTNHADPGGPNDERFPVDEFLMMVRLELCSKKQ